MPVSNPYRLGLGMYSPQEAARYARVSSHKMSSWLYGSAKADPVFEPELGREKRIVTFLDFAQTLSIHEIRLAARIPLRKVKEAYRNAQKDYGIEFPFAAQHGIFVFGDLKRPDRCELGIFVPGDEKRDEFLKRRFQLTGKKKGNHLLWSIIQPFSAKLEFTKKGIAGLYVAHESHGHRVVQDPNRRFGKPIIDDVGYEAQTLIDAVRIEKTIARAAKLYRVDESAIRTALDYNTLLQTPYKPKPPEPLAA